MRRFKVRGQRAGEHGLARQHRRVGGLRVNDLADDDRDVVRPAGAQRKLDEALRGDLGRAGAERRGDGFRSHGVGQAVGAQQVAIARLGVEKLEVRLDRAASVGLENQRLLRVGGHLAGVELALVDQRLDERVVLGDLGEDSLSQSVAARVADVDQAELGAVEHQARQGGAHAVLLGVFLH